MIESHCCYIRKDIKVKHSNLGVQDLWKNIFITLKANMTNNVFRNIESIFQKHKNVILALIFSHDQNRKSGQSWQCGTVTYNSSDFSPRQCAPSSYKYRSLYVTGTGWKKRLSLFSDSGAFEKLTNVLARSFIHTLILHKLLTMDCTQFYRMWFLLTSAPLSVALWQIQVFGFFVSSAWSTLLILSFA